MTRGKLGPGTLLDGGRFEVTRAIKEGGMGAVYEVMDRRLSNKRCALKEMLSASRDPDDRRQAREHFISEVQVMLGLRHPNIPRFTASFMQENSFYFVMEYIQGADLSCVLKERGSPGLPVDEVVSYGCQLLGALKYIHALNPPIVHRDIKPSNILRRDEDGTVVLIDFGIARVSNPGEGLWIGTPGYAPPEQQAGKPEPCSDVYALAATLHQLITGAKPEDFDFDKFKKYGIQVDPRLEDVIFQALATFPDDRTSSAEEMLSQLHDLGYYGPGENHGSMDFESAVCRCHEKVIEPILQTWIARFGNECHTRWVPKNLEFLQFVLACPTEFELQIVKNESTRRIQFFEKQGILDAKLLGEVDPLSDNHKIQAEKILENFTEAFENFKSSSWGFSF